MRMLLYNYLVDDGWINRLADRITVALMLQCCVRLSVVCRLLSSSDIIVLWLNGAS